MSAANHLLYVDPPSPSLDSASTCFNVNTSVRCVGEKRGERDRERGKHARRKERP